MNNNKGLIRAAKLSLLLLFRPQQFNQEEEADNARKQEAEKQALESHSESSERRKPRALVIRRAFFTSFFLVLTSMSIGTVTGLLLGCVTSCPSSLTVSLLQGVGAGVLLWGVLFIRGWEIQSWGGNTIGEQVNRWIYRALHLVGTGVIFFALAWSQCLT